MLKNIEITLCKIRRMFDFDPDTGQLAGWGIMATLSRCETEFDRVSFRWESRLPCSLIWHCEYTLSFLPPLYTMLDPRQGIQPCYCFIPHLGEGKYG